MPLVGRDWRWAGDKPPRYGLRYVIPAFTGIHLLLPLALAGDKPPRYGLRYVFPAKAGIHLLCATCHRPWRGTSPRATVSGTSFPRKRESNLFSLIATAPAGDKALRYRLTLSVIARLPFILRQAQHERQSRLGTYGKSGSIRMEKERAKNGKKASARTATSNPPRTA